MPSTALPTLSEVRAFTGDYLTSAARFWSGSATQWIDTVDGLTRDVSRPAGTSGWARPLKRQHCGSARIDEMSYPPPTG